MVFKMLLFGENSIFSTVSYFFSSVLRFICSFILPLYMGRQLFVILVSSALANATKEEAFVHYTSL